MLQIDMHFLLQYLIFDQFFNQLKILQITNPFIDIQTGIQTAYSKNFRQLLQQEHPQKNT